MRILLVGRRPLLGDGLRAGLRQLGFNVDWVRDGWPPSASCVPNPHDAAVLDLGLPMKDGGRCWPPARRDRRQAAGAGADARAMRVPMRIRGPRPGRRRLRAQAGGSGRAGRCLRALVRRAYGMPSSSWWGIDGVVLDRAGCGSDAGRRAEGWRWHREFDVLHALMLADGRVLSREQLEQRIYGWGQEVESNAVEVHVHHLRRKLGNGR